MESRTVPPPHASARQTEMGDTFNRVLFAALDAIESAGIPYALIGGIAASGLGRPRSTHDVDIFVRPEDADASLEALSRCGFETDKTDHRWLFKGWKDEMMVDIIFKSQGDIYFDTEMQSRARLIHYHGREIRAVAPEDLIIIKAAVHAEVGPHHWHDALAILSHASVDWSYLLKRARRATRRLLALLIYAQSNDIWIPNHVINELYASTFGQLPSSRSAVTFNQQVEKPPESSVRAPRDTQANHMQSQIYLIGHIRDRLATDPRTASADIQIKIGEKQILVKGETATADQRRAIEDVVRDVTLGYEIDNQVRLTHIAPPEAEEVV